LEAQALAGILADLSPDEHPEVRKPIAEPEPVSWRERLWMVPSETRLGVAEAAEALGRPKSYVYAHTGRAAEDPLPHRKLDGALLFTAGELRAWIRDHEETIHGGPIDPPSREPLRAI
jgi:hypothetical protein